MMDEVGGSTQNRSEENSPGVAETVQQAASAVTDTAQEAVSGVVEKVQDVTGAVASQASRVTDAAASQVESLADTVYQQGATPNAPAIQRNVAEKTANVLDRTAEYLREGDAQLILEDLRGTIRRHPGGSLLLGLAIGYWARSTFFGGGTAQHQGTRPSRSQSFVPRSQGVPVYGEGTIAGVDAAYYSTPTMPSSTISGDLGLGPDLDIPQSSLTSSTGMATGALVGDTGLDAYGGTTGTGIASGGLSDVDAYDTSIETVGDLSSSGLGTLDAPSDSGSVMQDDVTSGVTLGSDDVFIANTDLADPDSAEEAQQLGGEDFRSDTTSTDTMPSDDLLARWDAETRGQDDKA